MIDLIPVIPAAHYLCGGIQVNQFGETGLKGLLCYWRMQLYWITWSKSISIKLSLLESLVFSHRSALIL